MKVLFAVSNDKMSEAIVKQYQKDYKQIISYKNVYYFNAILKELQRDKNYDRIVISEDLEQYVNNDYEKMDKFLFDRLDSISDEASNMNGEDIPILLICSERRNKGEQIFVKLFGIGIYNAIIGNDRSVNEVCRLLNRPRSKKEAKIYYKIDSDDVSYERDDENEVSELEIQNILAHYKRIGNDEERYVESFDSIAAQYNDAQLKIISKFLPLKVRAVLEERSPKYQQINSYNNKISDKVRINKKQGAEQGTSEILLKNAKKANLTEPVVVPSAIGTSKKKIVSNQVTTQNSDTKEETVIPQPEVREVPEIEELLDIQIEEEPIIEEITDIQFDEIPTIEEKPQNNIPEISNEMVVETNEEVPVKRKRGRPRKIVEEPVEQTPKRKRGRPKKVVEPVEETQLPEIQEEEELLLPGMEEQTNQEDTLLPGLEPITNQFEAEEETILPGFEAEEETVLPGFGVNDEILPGFDTIEEEATLPEFGANEEETVLPGAEENQEKYANVLQDLKQESNEQDYFRPRPEKVEYQELDIESLITSGQKIVSFVGTSKNGTSFLINNVAELLSSNGIDTAILDLTQNRNSYYIYTKNEDNLREKSNYIMQNLKIGKANGIQEHRNLTIYTSPFENDDEIQDVEPIVETLLRNHTVILMDCDFTTPMRYFKYAQEIYLVQSMDILTIQPLTAFLRKLSDKNMLDESKVRVVLNKFIRTREINEELLIGGISIYNDAGMTVRRELFNRKTVQYVTIPFELKTYLRYLDGLVVCDVSLKGYSKEFMQSLRLLANMVYQTGNKNGKYMPPSMKNNNTFSQSMNDTLNQMKQNY